MSNYVDRFEEFVNRIYKDYSDIGRNYFPNGIGRACSFYDEKIINQLRRFFPEKTTVIADLGCGNGAKLASIFEYGYKNLIGCDVNSDCDPAAKSRIDFYPWDIFDFLKSREDRSIDVIIFNAVLEHFYPYEIEGILIESRRVLREKGVVILKVPNAASPFGGLYQYGDLTHKAILNQFSLSQMSVITGYDTAVFMAEGPQANSVRGFKSWFYWACYLVTKILFLIISLIVYKKNIVLSPNLIGVFIKDES